MNLIKEAMTSVSTLTPEQFNKFVYEALWVIYMRALRDTLDNPRAFMGPADYPESDAFILSTFLNKVKQLFNVDAFDIVYSNYIEIIANGCSINIRVNRPRDAEFAAYVLSDIEDFRKKSFHTIYFVHVYKFGEMVYKRSDTSPVDFYTLFTKYFTPAIKQKADNNKSITESNNITASTGHELIKQMIWATVRAIINQLNAEDDGWDEHDNETDAQFEDTLNLLIRKLNAITQDTWYWAADIEDTDSLSLACKSKPDIISFEFLNVRKMQKIYTKNKADLYNNLISPEYIQVKTCLSFTSNWQPVKLPLNTNLWELVLSIYNTPQTATEAYAELSAPDKANALLKQILWTVTQTIAEVFNAGDVGNNGDISQFAVQNALYNTPLDMLVNRLSDATNRTWLATWDEDYFELRLQSESLASITDDVLLFEFYNPERLQKAYNSNRTDLYTNLLDTKYVKLAVFGAWCRTNIWAYPVLTPTMNLWEVIQTTIKQ